MALYDLVCLSHLRWDFVYQRPQHLLSRCAKSHRVFFVEEPIFDAHEVRLDVHDRAGGVKVVVPHLESGTDADEAEAVQRHLIAQFFEDQDISRYVLWYYTPMALAFTQNLNPLAVVYDCMDELSAFQNAPKLLRTREEQLFGQADLVFTGGQSLYEAKRHRHPAVFAFPSSVDTAHFASALTTVDDPADQRDIPHPRIGFYGVVDERMDVELLAAVARLKPAWHWIIIGPIVKIDPATLPTAPNVHFLGSKGYGQLPGYLAGWDVAMMPFAKNESTRYISPTKTPEYLAAGKPVVSTSIRDVVSPYQDLRLVRIADAPDEFVVAVQDSLSEDPSTRRQLADKFLAANSWDKTWEQMDQLVSEVVSISKSFEKGPRNV